MNKTENHCGFFHEAILNYEWLDVEERNKLEDHLNICPECKRKHEGIQQMDLELTDLFIQEHEDFPDLSANIMASLKKTEKPRIFDFNNLVKYMAYAIITEVILLTFFQTDKISQTSSWGESYDTISSGLTNSFSDVLDLLSYGWHSTVIYGNYFSLGLDWILIFAVLFCAPLLISQLLLHNRKTQAYEHHTF